MRQKMMKAITYKRYGAPDVLYPTDIPLPVPQSDELLVKVHVSSVVAGDMRMRKADPFLARLFNGLFRPVKIPVLGFELSGEVVAVGPNVDKFQIGDQVFGSCGVKFGAYAQYKVISQDGIIAKKPENITHEQAAVVPISGIAAHNLLMMGGLQTGQRVLIIGASGGIGIYAIQIAKRMGAHVTGVCSGSKADFVRSLGVDEVVDYQTVDYLNNTRRYDLICDAAGKMYTGIGQSKFKKILNAGGQYVHSMMTLNYKVEDLQQLKQWMEDGTLQPVIDKVFSIRDIVQAHQYFESGNKAGHVAVTIDF